MLILCNIDTNIDHTHFGKVCERIGFKKGVVDTIPEGDRNGSVTDSDGVIYIEHGKRNSIVRKMTFSKKTIDDIDRLLGDKLDTGESVYDSRELGIIDTYR